MWINRSVLTCVAICAGLSAASVSAAPSPYQAAKRVDRLLARDLFDQSTVLAPAASDAVFFRRVSFDIVGSPPTSDEVRAFLRDDNPRKRERIVRELLAADEYGVNWARYWRDVILYRRLEDRAALVAPALEAELTEKLNANLPWDEIARQFITSTGDVRQEGDTAILFAQDGRTEEVAAEVSRIFLGIQIQCAQCHDHPYDRWQREQFHEFAAFFPRVGVRPVRTETERSFAVFASDNERRPKNAKPNARRPAAEHFMPDLEDPAAAGTRMTPRFFLTGADASLGATDAQRRGSVGHWITADPWFSKALVNRVWAELVGEGFHEPIDDMGPDREATAPAAFEFLANAFVESGYDLKWLIAAICASDAYQRECRPRRQSDEKPFTANVAHPLRADQVFDALQDVLEMNRQRNNQADGGTPRRGRGGPRAAFTLEFGYDPSIEREAVAASIPQALLLMNSPQVHRATLAARRSMLGQLMTRFNDRQLIEELYLKSLSRPPSVAELNAAVDYVRRSPSRAEGCEDVLWALVNSAEFVHRR